MKKTFILLATTIALFSCTKDDMYFFNSNNKVLGINIPSGFNWSVTKTVKVNIEVNDHYSGKFLYEVKIYIQNPNDVNAEPIKAGFANINQPFNEDITIPSASTTIYVQQIFINADGTREVTTKAVNVDKISNVKFTDADKSVTRDISSSDTNGKTLKNEVGSTNNWRVLKNGDDIFNNNQNLIVKSGESVTVKVTNQAFNNAKLYVEPGAVLHVQQTNNGQGFIIGVNSIIYNDGSIYVEDINGNANGTFKIKNGATLDNNGCIITGNVLFDTNKGNKCNMSGYSYISANKIELGSNVDISMNTGSWIRTKELCIDGGQGNEKESTITGIGDNIGGYKYKAFIQVDTYSSKNNAKCIVDGNILIESADAVPPSMTLKPGTERVVDASGLIKIPGTACSGGYGIETQSTSSYVYGMEDQFPNAGDYDMNDLVIEIESIATMNTDNVTKSVNVNWTIYAIGANYQIAAGVEFNGKTELLFNDAHQVMGNTSHTFINTEKDCTPVEYKSGSIKFDNLNLSSLNMDNDLKFFIKANGKQPIYIAEQGGIKGEYIGGIRIPTSCYKSYPLEKVCITQAFPNIYEWIKKGCTCNMDWYNYPKSGCVKTIQP